MTDNIIDITGRLKGKKPVVALAPVGVPTVDQAINRAAYRNPLQIREWRYHVGMSQMGLATRMGVDIGYISRVEKGQRTVTADRLVQFAEALGVEVGDLFKAPPAQTASPRV